MTYTKPIFHFQNMLVHIFCFYQQLLTVKYLLVHSRVGVAETAYCHSYPSALRKRRGEWGCRRGGGGNRAGGGDSFHA